MDDPMDVEMIDLEQMPKQHKSLKSQITPLPPILESPNKKRKKSTSFQQDKNATVTTNKTSLNPIVSRKIVKAVRKYNNTSLTPTSSTITSNLTHKNRHQYKFSPKSIFILDTNILVSHSTDLKGLIEKLSVEKKLMNIRLVITKVVLDELDHLKRDKPSVNQVCKFVRDRLKCEHFIGEDSLLTNDEKKSDTLKNHEIVNNDDKILRTTECIKEIHKSTSYVALVTDDINLHNKCLLHQVTFLDWKDFFSKITSKSIVDETFSSSTAINNDEDEHTNCKKRRSFSPTMNIVEQGTFRKNTKNKIEIEDEDEEEEQDSYAEWIKLKEAFTLTMKEFLVKYLKEMYGDLWKKIFQVDWSTCTFEQIINTLKNYWIGTFSDAFGRKKEILDLITNIRNKLQTEMNNYHELKEQLSLLQVKIKPYI